MGQPNRIQSLPNSKIMTDESSKLPALIISKPLQRMHFSLFHQNCLEREVFTSGVPHVSVVVSGWPGGKGSGQHSRDGPFPLQNLMGQAQIALQQFVCLLEISVSLTSSVVFLIETKILFAQLRELHSDVHFRVVRVLYLSRLLWRVVDSIGGRSFFGGRSFLGERVRALRAGGRESSQRLNLFPSGPKTAGSFVLTLGLRLPDIAYRVPEFKT